jgi:carbon monoxide dehydrogenase subunit G
VELENSFTVDVGVDRAWEVLTDIPAIAPCLPGAQLQEVDGDDYKGIVKVKVGPIVAQYKGTATVQEENPADRNASALITASLEERDGRTEVVVSTDLTVTGKVAQFGRGVMADVSAKLMDQFAANLVETVLSDEAGGAGTAEGGTDDGGQGSGDARSAGPGGNGSSATGQGQDEPRKLDPGPEPEPIDLLGTAGTPVAQRVIPPLVGAVLLLLVIRWLLRRRRG